MNNPLKYTDPDGLDWWVPNKADESGFARPQWYDGKPPSDDWRHLGVNVSWESAEDQRTYWLGEKGQAFDATDIEMGLEGDPGLPGPSVGPVSCHSAAEPIINVEFDTNSLFPYRSQSTAAGFTEYQDLWGDWSAPLPTEYDLLMLRLQEGKVGPMYGDEGQMHGSRPVWKTPLPGVRVFADTLEPVPTDGIDTLGLGVAEVPFVLFAPMRLIGSRVTARATASRVVGPSGRVNLLNRNYIDQINAFRQRVGLKPWEGAPPDKNTVALIRDSRNTYGVNSGLQNKAGDAYGLRGEALSEIQLTLGRLKAYDVNQLQAFLHAEMLALIRYKSKSGSLAGRRIVVYVDRLTCNNCLGTLGLQHLVDLYKLKGLRVIDAKGRVVEWVPNGPRGQVVRKGK